MMYGDYYFPGEELDQMAEGGIPSRYKNMGFSKVGAKKKSTRPGKKWMVLAKKGDKYKVVHGGDSKMKDFSQHGSEKRKDRFWDRMGGKDSAKANDPFSPLYWHKRFGTWAEGGEPQNEGFQALPEAVQAKIMANMMYGGDMYQLGGIFDSLKGVRDLVLGDTPEERMQTKKLALKALPMFLKDGGMPCYECGGKIEYADGGVWFNEDSQDFYQAGGQMIRRADGSYSRRGLWDNIRANRGSGKKPTKEMLEQEAKINSKKDGGIHIDPAKKGTFKAQATRMGLSVQEAAKKILDAPEGRYSPEMRRKANFAMNFAKEYGGMPEYQFAGSTEEPLFELQTAITGLQPKGFDMRMFDSLEETKKRMENPSDLIQRASPIKPIEPERGFSLANQAAYVTGLRALEAMTRDNSAEKRYNASQTLADSYGPVQRMNPFDWYGEYVTNQGDLLNPRQMAPVQFRGMDYPMYMEEGGQVVELDDKQIKQLLALGAEIEMLDQ